LRSFKFDGQPFSLESQHEWIFQTNNHNEPNPCKALVFLSLDSIIVPRRAREIALPFSIHPERVGITHAHELESSLLYEDIYEQYERPAPRAVGSVFYLFDWTTNLWEKLPEAPFRVWFHVVETRPGLITFATVDQLYDFERERRTWTKRDNLSGFFRQICGLAVQHGHLYVLERGPAHLTTVHVWPDGSLLRQLHPDLSSRHPPLPGDDSCDNLAVFGFADQLFQNLMLVDADPGWRELSWTLVAEVPVENVAEFNVLEYGLWPAVGLSAIGIHVAGKTITLPLVIYAYNSNPQHVFVCGTSVFFLVERNRLFRYNLKSDIWQELPPEERFKTSDFASILESETGDIFLGHLTHVKVLRNGAKQWKYFPDMPSGLYVVSLALFSQKPFAVCTHQGKKMVLVSLDEDTWVYHCEVPLPVSQKSRLVYAPKINQ
jgi:hypothetical protein